MFFIFFKSQFHDMLRAILGYHASVLSQKTGLKEATKYLPIYLKQNLNK